MTREEIIRNLKYTMEKHKNDTVRTFDTNISVMCKDILDYLEQEPSKDEVILTNKEYRELISNEYEHGYCKGYAVAVEEQKNILDKIRAEIEQNAYPIVHGVNNHELGMTLYGILQIIDKYKAESEEV